MKKIIIAVAVLIAGVGAWYFLAGSTDSKVPVRMANPASVNCVETLGGTLRMLDTPEGQAGYCSTPDGHFCEEWALFRGEDCATFYLGETQQYLLLDTGTAPPPRMLSVLDISLGTTTYTGLYNRPVEIGEGTFTFWQPVDEAPTAQNCPDLAEWESNGLGAGMERRVTLDLETLEIRDLGEERCSARQ